MDLPIKNGLPQLVQVRAGSFSLLDREALLNLARGSLGESEFNRLRGLLLQGTVLSRSQYALWRALLGQAADPSTPPGVRAAVLAQAAALISGKFEESIPELLATRIDRDRLVDLRAGIFAKLGGSDTIASYSGGLVRSIAGVANIGGAPSVADVDGYPVVTPDGSARAAYPFFIGPDGLTNTFDDLPYVANNPAAQAAGYHLAPPIAGTPQDRFDQVNGATGPTPIPLYSATAQIAVPSAASPPTLKTVEVYGEYNPDYLTLQGCVRNALGYGLGGTFDRVTKTCTAPGGADVTAQARAIGCSVIAASNSPTKFGIGINADDKCIELNSSARFPQEVQYEVLALLGDAALRPTVAGIEPSDLTDLSIRSFALPARPVSPNGTVVFPPVIGGFRRNADPVTGAPAVSTGGTCRIRLNGSSVPVGPNGIAGDGDDGFPSAGSCLLWGAPDAGGAQHLALPSLVAANHGANQTLFHELCSAGRSRGVGWVGVRRARRGRDDPHASAGQYRATVELRLQVVPISRRESARPARHLRAGHRTELRARSGGAARLR